LVRDGGTRVAPVPSSGIRFWARRSWWRRSRVGSSLYLNVIIVNIGVVVALTLAASVLIQPGHGVVVSTPVGHDNAHTRFEIAGHVRKISRAIRSKGNLVITLNQVSSENSCRREVGLDGERFGGIDLLSRTELTSSLTNLEAAASSITVGIDTS
jgi:hypothetical protein